MLPAVLRFIANIGMKGVGKVGCLKFPIGVTTGHNMNIVVCDSGNNMVKVYEWKGAFKFTIGGGSVSIHANMAVFSTIIIN